MSSCLASHTFQCTRQVRGRPVAHMQTRIPSWLHMPSMAMPTVASWGENLGDMVDLAQVWNRIDIQSQGWYG